MYIHLNTEPAQWHRDRWPGEDRALHPQHVMNIFTLIASSRHFSFGVRRPPSLGPFGNVSTCQNIHCTSYTSYIHLGYFIYRAIERYVAVTLSRHRSRFHPRRKQNKGE